MPDAVAATKQKAINAPAMAINHRWRPVSPFIFSIMTISLAKVCYG
jgi:hypothetical protein